MKTIIFIVFILIGFIIQAQKAVVMKHNAPVAYKTYNNKFRIVDTLFEGQIVKVLRINKKRKYCKIQYFSQSRTDPFEKSKGITLLMYLRLRENKDKK